MKSAKYRLYDYWPWEASGTHHGPTRWFVVCVTCVFFGLLLGELVISPHPVNASAILPLLPLTSLLLGMVHKLSYAISMTVLGTLTVFAHDLLQNMPANLLVTRFAVLMSVCLIALLASLWRKENRSRWEAKRVDPMTGLQNKLGFIEVAGFLMRAHDRPWALIFIDCDHFKRVNDQYGHLLGDAVLYTLARTMTHCLPGIPCLARYGGDEFAACLQETDKTRLAQLCRHIAREIATAVEREHGIPFHVSVGYSISVGKSNLDEMIREADQSMYQAKSSDRNREIADAMDPSQENTHDKQAAFSK